MTSPVEILLNLDLFIDDLLVTSWFPETVDLYFSGEYRQKYNEVMESLVKRKIVKKINGRLMTTVKP